MTTRVALYARVSTKDRDQNPEVQLAALQDYCRKEGFEVVGEYVDKASALDFVGRKAWARLMKDASLRKFDKLLVWRLDRAFRDISHSSNTVQVLESFGIGFRSISDLPMDTTGPMADILRVVRVAYSALEVAGTKERIRDGMQHAKQNGTKSGRPIGRKPLGVNFAIICKALQDGKNADGSVNFSESARKLAMAAKMTVSPAYFYRPLDARAEELGRTREELISDILTGKVSS